MNEEMIPTRLQRYSFALLLQKEDPLANRTILYQMVALYDYAAQGPEDLEFSEGDTIDILGEGEAPQLKVKLCVFVFHFKLSHSWILCSRVRKVHSLSFPLTLSHS